MLIAGVSASHQHQSSTHREQVARLVRLISCRTRRVVGQSGSWISLDSESPETQNASSGSVGPAQGQGSVAGLVEERSFEYPSQVQVGVATAVADAETAGSAAVEVGRSLITV